MPQRVKHHPASANGRDEPPKGKPLCFVMMPITDPPEYAPGHFRRVFEDIFVPACTNAGFKAMRADQVHHTNLIHVDVLQKVIKSPMALCDLSSRNPNVLFELGLRVAFDRPVLLVRDVGTVDLFDIAPLRFTEYRRDLIYNEVLEDQEFIATALHDTFATAGKGADSANSIVQLLSLPSPAPEPQVPGDLTGAMLLKLSAQVEAIQEQLGVLRQMQAQVAADNQPPRAERPPQRASGSRKA